MAAGGDKTGQKTLAVFGATGSIGGNTLDIAAAHGARFDVRILTGGRNVARLVELTLAHKPEHIALADENAIPCLRDGLAAAGMDMSAVEIHGGNNAIAELAKIKTDITMAAITGIAGLLPTYNAVCRGGVISIANKESLVAAGGLIMEAARQSGAVILPVDSEHNAIHQVMRGEAHADIARIVLTASGGPFHDFTRDAMRGVTPAMACAHPNWAMGKKISVDSATMMNKGFEVMEAGVLFGLPEERIDVLVHRQSLFHGMVCFRDGAMLAGLAAPDMRIPISYCLAWPTRLPRDADPVTAEMLAQLTFTPPDDARFPCINLAREAMRAGGLAPAALNAANEVAVAAFLEGRIGFLDIAAINGDSLAAMHHPSTIAGLDAILAHDAAIRALCRDNLLKRA